MAKMNAFIPRPGFENELAAMLADTTGILAACDTETEALEACEAQRHAWMDELDCVFGDFTLDELYPQYGENGDIIGWEFETYIDTDFSWLWLADEND